MLRSAGALLLQSLACGRLTCTSWRAACFASAALQQPSRVMFLGTPQVAADVLKLLVDASSEHRFEVCAVVTKAADPSSKDKNDNRHVHRAALKLGLKPQQILTPDSPKEPEFLDAVSKLAPDLCITAAYGAMLPQAFLNIPRRGTLNIHPSLLPKYRGAAPVQRALQAGEQEVGVSLVYTELRCDAGPILEQTKVQLSGEEQAPELTRQLFKLGTHLLLARLGDVLSGRAVAKPQDESQATHAPKVRAQEAALDPSLTALQLHNQVRAMSGWPGSHIDLLVQDRKTGVTSPLQVHVLKTRVVQMDSLSEQFQRRRKDHPWGFRERVHFGDDAMLVPCGGDTLLDLVQVKALVHKPAQPNVVSGQDFMRKLGKRVRLLLPPRQDR